MVHFGLLFLSEFDGLDFFSNLLYHFFRLNYRVRLILVLFLELFDVGEGLVFDLIAFSFDDFELLFADWLRAKQAFLALLAEAIEIIVHSDACELCLKDFFVDVNHFWHFFVFLKLLFLRLQRVLGFSQPVLDAAIRLLASFLFHLVIQP